MELLHRDERAKWLRSGSGLVLSSAIRGLDARSRNGAPFDLLVPRGRVRSRHDLGTGTPSPDHREGGGAVASARDGSDRAGRGGIMAEAAEGEAARGDRRDP